MTRAWVTVSRHYWSRKSHNLHTTYSCAKALLATNATCFSSRSCESRRTPDYTLSLFGAVPPIQDQMSLPIFPILSPHSLPVNLSMRFILSPFPDHQDFIYIVYWSTWRIGNRDYSLFGIQGPQRMHLLIYRHTIDRNIFVIFGGW